MALTFFVDPGNRVYVRNITFSGTTRINDEVLRREMRLLEGGWLSNVALERSKQRLQRLPYIKECDSNDAGARVARTRWTSTTRSRRARRRSSPAASATRPPTSSMLNGNYTDANFLGTGHRVAVNLQGGAYNKVYGSRDQPVHHDERPERRRCR